MVTLAEMGTTGRKQCLELEHDEFSVRHTDLDCFPYIGDIRYANKYTCLGLRIKIWATDIALRAFSN